MRRILIVGMCNLETTVRIDGFPIDYEPVRYSFFGMNSTVSGVGFNVAKALRTLGDEPVLLSLIGEDAAAVSVRHTLEANAIAADFVRTAMPTTCQSVILYDAEGRRLIYTDLKNVQEERYPAAVFEQARAGCALAVLCNINFSRPLLSLAQAAALPIATDVHTIADLDDEYNRDYMAAADILFMSDEKLPLSAADWIAALQAAYPRNRIAVVGMGEKGALLGVRGAAPVLIPAVQTQPIVNTVGAGDALFASFIHFYAKSADPLEALRRAVVFASYKIGAAGAAEGFLDEAGVEERLA